MTAAPDTLHVAGRIVAHMREAGLEGWHEFYLLAGTAAVTLVGLLFVALSFNLDTLIHESRAHVLAHARSTLVSFSYVLIVSLGFLIPAQSASRLGVMIAIASLIVLGVHLRGARRRPGTQAPAFESGMRRRSRIFLIAYAIAAINGIAMVWLNEPMLAFNMIGVICMLLGNAMGTSWDMLVEVGKLRAEGGKGGA